MKWIKISVETTRGGVEPVCARLQAMGHDALEIEDWDDFKDFVENRKPYWQLVEDGLAESLRGLYRVSFYLPEDTADALEQARGALAGMGGDAPPVRVTSSVSDDADWAGSWKKYYKPIAVGKRVLIQPEWEPLDGADGRAVFWCEPGVSFGTGSHATTFMCLELLDEWTPPGISVADLGCGSGILSVTALLLGASEAVAADIDPLAADAARRNAERNGFPGMAVLCADLLCGGVWDTLGAARFDIVCANLVSELLKTLAGRIADIMRPGGRLFASGVLERDAGDVRRVLEGRGLVHAETRTRDGWAALHMTKNKLYI
ncbi:MAG: 50S ribosomal protein L11 methyltransferase [Oscillospiraceae bacterium]|nr:50S ribosomal protein L11 methyltransferase [Oscillospiraceae bacterium]